MGKGREGWKGSERGRLELIEFLMSSLPLPPPLFDQEDEEEEEEQSLESEGARKRERESSKAQSLGKLWMEPQTSTNSWFTCHQSMQLLESHECDILLPGVLFTSGFSVVKVQYLARKVRPCPCLIAILYGGLLNELVGWLACWLYHVTTSQ